MRYYNFLCFPSESSIKILFILIILLPIHFLYAMVIAYICISGLFSWGVLALGIFLKFLFIVLASLTFISFVIVALLRQWETKELLKKMRPLEDVNKELSRELKRVVKKFFPRIHSLPEFWCGNEPKDIEKRIAMVFQLPGEYHILIYEEWLKNKSNKSIIGVVLHEIGHIEKYDFRFFVAKYLAKECIILSVGTIIVEMFWFPEINHILPVDLTLYIAFLSVILSVILRSVLPHLECEADGYTLFLKGIDENWKQDFQKEFGNSAGIRREEYLQNWNKKCEKVPWATAFVLGLISGITYLFVTVTHSGVETLLSIIFFEEKVNHSLPISSLNSFLVCHISLCLIAIVILYLLFNLASPALFAPRRKLILISLGIAGFASLGFTIPTLLSMYFVFYTWSPFLWVYLPLLVGTMTSWLGFLLSFLLLGKEYIRIWPKYEMFYRCKRKFEAIAVTIVAFYFLCVSFSYIVIGANGSCKLRIEPHLFNFKPIIGYGVLFSPLLIVFSFCCWSFLRRLRPRCPTCGAVVNLLSDPDILSDPVTCEECKKKCKTDIYSKDIYSDWVIEEEVL